jgi:hypothetical protein
MGSMLPYIAAPWILWVGVYHGRKNKCIWIFSWLGLMETYHHEKMTTNTDVAFLVAIGSNRKYNRLLLSFQREYNEYIYI